MMKALRGPIINNKWSYALKRVIRFDITVIAEKKIRIKKVLIKAVEEALRSSCASQVLAERLALNQHLKAEHEGRIVRAKQRAMGQEGIKAAAWTRV